MRMDKVSLNITAVTFCIVVVAVLNCACQSTNPRTQIWYVKNIHLETELRYLDSIEAIDPDNGQEYVVVQEQPGQAIPYAVFSPDGRHIAYGAGSDTAGTRDIVADSDGSNPREVSSANDSFGSVPYWLSPSTLLMVDAKRRPDNTLEYRSFIYDIARKESQKMDFIDNNESTNFCGPIVSLEGDDPRWLIWDQTSIGTKALMVDKGIARIVEDTKYHFPGFESFFGAYCSDRFSRNRQFAFSGGVGIDARKIQNIFVAREDNKTIGRLTSFERDYGKATATSMAISPDGRWVIFSVSFLNPKGQGLADGNYVALLNTEDKSMSILSKTWNKGIFAWSPDSKYVAADLYPPGDLDTEAEIFVIDIQTRKMKQVTFDGIDKELIAWRYVLP